MSASGYVHIEVDRILKETDKAFLVVINDYTVWLPKSQIADADDYGVGDIDVEISVTDYIANEKELI